MKTLSDGVLKVAKGSLVHLKDVKGNNGHVLLKSGGVHHVERGARRKSQRRVTFDDGGHNDRWCTKRVNDGFGLKGEPRPKSYVEVVIRTPRKVSFDDDERFGLEGEIFVPSTKSHDGQSKTRGEDDYLSKEAAARSSLLRHSNGRVSLGRSSEGSSQVTTARQKALE